MAALDLVQQRQDPLDIGQQPAVDGEVESEQVAPAGRQRADIGDGVRDAAMDRLEKSRPSAPAA